jgi:hypothetical protein
VLAVLLQMSRDNCRRFGATGAIDKLLAALAVR